MKQGLMNIDLLVVGAAEVATPMGDGPRGGSQLGQIKVLPKGAVACDGSRILEVGPESELRAKYCAHKEVLAHGGTVIPGFVDAHTHPVFHGTRELEFEMRTAGRTYVEISQAGGGIASSLRGVRTSSHELLLSGLMGRLERFLELGTTTVEAKTGYGLTVHDELKCLEVIAAANKAHCLDLVPTCLGAHDYPPEYRDRREEYVQLVLQEMLPAVADSGLARYFDIFTEAHAFDIETSRRIMERAKDLGLGLRMHVDQLTSLGGAELAAELGAASADHLEHVSPRGIEALSAAGVIPVLSPLVALYLRVEGDAPARAMIDAGLAPALSTDFNPGSCYVQSMPEVLTWAALRYRMTAAEALTAGTLNAAASLGLAAEVGSLEAGKKADILVLDLPGHLHLTYELGRNPVRSVIKSGKLVVER